MAFTDMLKNQYTGGRGAGVADTGSSTGSSSYGNGFLGTFANLVLGNLGNQGNVTPSYVAGGYGDPNYERSQFETDVLGNPVYHMR